MRANDRVTDRSTEADRDGIANLPVLAVHAAEEVPCVWETLYSSALAGRDRAGFLRVANGRRLAVRFCGQCRCWFVPAEATEEAGLPTARLVSHAHRVPSTILWQRAPVAAWRDLVKNRRELR